MTYLELVNKVLRRLREDEVATVTQNDYSTLIGDFVNQAKREVEDAWNWTVLRDTIQVTTTASVFRYTLTGVNQRCRLLIDPLTNRPDAYNVTHDAFMLRAPSSQWMTRHFLLGTQQEGQAIYFDLNGYDSNGVAVLDIWPIPSDAQELNFNFVIPQDDFDAGADTLKVPSYPVILRAYALAISERGEDQGNISNEVDIQASIALSDAIAMDTRNVPEELIWRPV